MSAILRDLQRDEIRAVELIRRMANMVREIDPKSAERFDTAKFNVESGVLLFEIGPGNPVPSVPALQFSELGGEG